MCKQIVAFMVFVVAALAAQAGYTVKVNAVPNLTAAAGSIAVLPANCPSQVDCVWLDGKIAKELARYKQLRTIDADTVSQVMFNLGIDSVSTKQGSELAQRLGVNSLLVVQVGHSETTNSEMLMYRSGGLKRTPIQINRGALEVSIVNAQTGKVLMKGKAFGETDMRSQMGVLAKSFQKILREAFGKPE